MKKFKRNLVLLISLSSIFFMGCDLINVDEDLNSLLPMPTFRVISDSDELRQTAEEYGIELTIGGLELKEIILEDYPEVEVIDKQSRAWGDYVLSTWTSEFCNIDYYDSASGYGPGTLTLSQSTTQSSSYSANVSISASIVTAGVGFTVGVGVTTTASYTYILESGEWAEIRAHLKWRKKGFDVYNWLDDKKGSGSAETPVGTCYALYN